MYVVLSMHERYHTEKAVKWTAKAHGDGRITALCSSAGTGHSKSTGIRNRWSKNQGCSARVKKRDVMYASSEARSSTMLEPHFVRKFAGL